jgi:hypothetical protein
MKVKIVFYRQETECNITVATVLLTSLCLRR